MPLHPEQIRALAYARKRGTDAPVESIRERVAATYADFEALVDGTPASLARQSRSATEWSVQEVVDHLVESDRAAIEQLSQLFSGQSCAVPIPASLQSQHPRDLDWDALRHQFRTVHENVLALLAKATDDIPLSATAAVQMVVKCADAEGNMRPVSWIEHFDWKAYSILLHAHNREHIAQTQRILSDSSR
ncbi:MAG: DinB family protein [Acidobacteriota bacterium]|nr:DinB family protein [Acidobacteriota bacterium]